MGACNCSMDADCSCNAGAPPPPAECVPTAMPVVRLPRRDDLSEYSGPDLGDAPADVPEYSPGNKVICFLGGVYCDGLVFAGRYGRVDEILFDGSVMIEPEEDAGRLVFTSSNAAEMLRSARVGAEARAFEATLGETVEIKQPCRRFVEGSACRRAGCSKCGEKVELENLFVGCDKKAISKWREGVVICPLMISREDRTLWCGVAFSPHDARWVCVDNVRAPTKPREPTYGLQDVNYPPKKRSIRAAAPGKKPPLPPAEPVCGN